MGTGFMKPGNIYSGVALCTGFVNGTYADCGIEYPGAWDNVGMINTTVFNASICP